MPKCDWCEKEVHSMPTNIEDLLKNMNGTIKTEAEIVTMIHKLAKELNECFLQEAENPKLEGFVKALQWVLGKEIYREQYRCYSMPGPIGK